MKKIIYILFCLFVLCGCREKAKIVIINELPNAIMKDVKWGSFSLSGSLYPGVSSAIYTLEESDGVSFPKESIVSFYLELNNKSVYLETRQTYRLDKDEFLRIVIDESTPVYNPLGAKPRQ
ncbi:MAG: hypothetical protein ACLSC9_02315 [Barnesiella sp.]